jgi:hypothetical protein
MVSLDFSVTYSFRQFHGPGVDSAPSENDYQKHFLGGKGGRCVRLTTSPPSCAECNETREPIPAGTLWATTGLLRESFTFTFYMMDSLRAGRSGVRIPVEARFPAPVQTGSEAHPAYYTKGIGSFLGVKRPERGVDHPPPSSFEVKERVRL